MKALALAWRLLLRDWKSGELTVLGLALMIAVTSLTAVAFLTDRVGHAVELRAAESLAADLRLGSSQPLPKDYLELADQAGLQTASMISMPSVGRSSVSPPLSVFMNWAKRTRSPLLLARTASPTAEVVFPFPEPVMI